MNKLTDYEPGSKLKVVHIHPPFNKSHALEHSAGCPKKSGFHLFHRKHRHCAENGQICNNAIRRRLVEMGIVPGAEIIIERFAPLGDPVEVKVGETRISLRKVEADMVEVKELATIEE